jgi:hypothetical protein
MHSEAFGKYRQALMFGTQDRHNSGWEWNQLSTVFGNCPGAASGAYQT